MVGNIKILSWQGTGYLKRVLRGVERKINIECRDTTDFGLEGYIYDISQSSFDKLIQEYRPDIIVLQDRTSRNLPIDIPEDIKVLIYCDHCHEQLCIFGKPFFNVLPKNNYLYYVILDGKNLDRDGVLGSNLVSDRMFFKPFLPCIEEDTTIEDQEACDTYSCDISVMLRHKKIEYYYACECISSNNFLGRILMQFVSELVYAVRHEIHMNETAYMEDEVIQQLVLRAMDHLKLGQYIRDGDEFFKCWFNEVKSNIIPTEYGNCIVDWLVEKDYNIKLYGADWKSNKRYEKYAFGEIPDGSAELRKAYRHSRINIGTSVNMGIHRRAFEAIENGCICLQAEAHPDWMHSDWRNYFEDGKEILVFHNKKELYQKVEYLLSNESECEKIIKNAQEKIKSFPTVEDLFGDVIMDIYQR